MGASQATPGLPNADEDREIHLQEWEKARDFLASFDDKLHDLRKYGFSLVTAFLTADGLMLSSTLSKDAPINIKFSVFGVTLILILAIQLIDKNYTVFQKAAATRALVLERKLNIELSDIITQRYHIEHINWLVRGIYLLFTVSVLFLGCISFGSQYIYSLILALLAVVVTGLTIRLDLTFKTKNIEDWMISPLTCSLDGTVNITLTNLCDMHVDNNAKEMLNEIFHRGNRIPEPIVFRKGDILWEIINEETGEIKPKIADRHMKIYDSQTWILKGKEIGKAGVYQLRPRGWPIPLHRRIVITDIANNRTRKT